MDNEREIPQYFICPISLQIMKEPVTTETGITYDRECIERWLLRNKNASCPVTKHRLSPDSELTPNHTLRRLIQSWRTAKAELGTNRVLTEPSKDPPPSKSHLLMLLHRVSVPHLQRESLQTLVTLASQSQSSRRCMEELDVAKVMVGLIISSFKSNEINVCEQALSLLCVVKPSLESLKLLIVDNYDFIDSITWILLQDSDQHKTSKTQAVLIFKMVIEVAPIRFLERLKVDFFQGLLQVVKEEISKQSTKAALRILLASCPCGRNRMKMIEGGAAFRLIEFLLSTMERRSNELALGVLDHICSTADGRAEFLGHAAGLSLLSKRMLGVSPAADDCAVRIISSIGKFSATNEVAQEMLNVGVVAKLCLVLQADCGPNVKEKAMGVLRMHSKAWRNSPCISVDLLTKHP